MARRSDAVVLRPRLFPASRPTDLSRVPDELLAWQCVDHRDVSVVIAVIRVALCCGGNGPRARRPRTSGEPYRSTLWYSPCTTTSTPRGEKRVLVDGTQRALTLTRWITERSARQNLDLLQGLDLARLREVGEARDVDPGTRICAAGEQATAVLVVTDGEVELLARLPGGGRMAMAVVRAGGVIADIPLLLGTPMPFDAVTSRPTAFIRLTREAWVALLGSSPALSFRWMASIARRLDSDRRRLAVITTRPLEQQVAYLLLEHQEEGPSGDPVVRLSHAVMAQLLGARRQSVSRVLGALRTRGLVAPGYGFTRLLDVPGLQELAGPDVLP